MEITVRADTTKQLFDLLTKLAHETDSSLPAEIAAAIASGNAELMAQLNQMRLSQMQTKETLMYSLDEVLKATREATGTANSVAAFIKGLEGRLAEAAAGADPATQAKLKAIMDEAMAQKQVFAEAIDNDPNTPAKPTEPVVTPPGGPTTPPDAPAPTDGQPPVGSVTGG